MRSIILLLPLVLIIARDRCSTKSSNADQNVCPEEQIQVVKVRYNSVDCMSLLYLSATLGTECYRGDIDCARMVYNVVNWRSKLSATSMIEVISVPYQFSGLDVSRPPRELMSHVYYWYDTSLSLLIGDLDVSYMPRSTHYAHKNILFKTPFGQEAVRRNCGLYHYTDGHVMIGDCQDGDYLRFRIK